MRLIIVIAGFAFNFLNARIGIMFESVDFSLVLCCYYYHQSIFSFLPLVAVVKVFSLKHLMIDFFYPHFVIASLVVLNPHLHNFLQHPHLLLHRRIHVCYFWI